MKIILVSMFVLILGVIAQACPDLAGSYSCKDCGQDFDLLVSQTENQEGYTVYNFNGYDNIADGVSRIVSDETGNFVITNTCEVQVLVSHIVGVIHDGEKRTPIDITSRMIKNVDGTILDEDFNENNVPTGSMTYVPK